MCARVCITAWPLNTLSLSVFFFYLKLSVNHSGLLVWMIRQESFCHCTRAYVDYLMTVICKLFAVCCMRSCCLNEVERRARG